MLIRSQSRKMLTNPDNISHIRIIENKNNLFEIFVYSYNSQWIGDYSTEEKAIKVLDMIQNAYARCESVRTLTAGTVFEIAREFQTEERVNEYKNIHRENFVFQMPQDEDVEV